MNANYSKLQRMYKDQEHQQERDIVVMNKKEALLIRDELKKKWSVHHQEYQGSSHFKQFDTIGIRRR